MIIVHMKIKLVMLHVRKNMKRTRLLIMNPAEMIVKRNIWNVLHSAGNCTLSEQGLQDLRITMILNECRKSKSPALRAAPFDKVGLHKENLLYLVYRLA